MTGGIASVPMSHRSPAPPILLLPLVAVLVLVAAACGDSSPDATAPSALGDTTKGAPTAETTAPEPRVRESTPARSATTDEGPDGGIDGGTDEGEAEMLFPDVLDVVITPEGGDRYRFDVTLSSPYDSPGRYADGWRVLGPDGTVLGERPLLHDHASEQPFTRSLDGVEIPEGITEVTVQGRDQLSGWGGAEVTVAVPGR